MKEYIARRSGEYSLCVEARSPDAALQKAEKVPIEEWSVAWSDIDIDEEYTGEGEEE